MHFAELVGDTRIKQNALSGRCLTSINMRHDADIARPVDRCQPRHDIYGLATSGRRILVSLTTGSEQRFQASHLAGHLNKLPRFEWGRINLSPPVVSKGLIRLCHPVGIFTLFNSRAT